MTAVAGEFVKIDQVASRKVARLTIEIPIETANHVLQVLGGYPDPANAKQVGIALLEGLPATNTVKGGGMAANAGMLCDNAEFQAFARSLGYGEPAKLIYARCDVTSRKYLDHDAEAASEFRALRDEFENWRAGRRNQLTGRTSSR